MFSSSTRGDSVLFEAFEASPLSEDVLAAKNALRWDFPGSAVTIPISEYEKTSFQDELATFLERATTESIKRFAAHQTKLDPLHLRAGILLTPRSSHRCC
jgi:hypothetical protein